MGIKDLLGNQGLGEVMADQVNVQVVIEKDLGDAGTWRDALYITLDEYNQMQADHTFDDWHQNTKEERYANFVKATTPDPVEVAQAEATDIAAQIDVLLERHAEVTARIRELDPKADVPGISAELAQAVSVQAVELLRE